MKSSINGQSGGQGGMAMDDGSCCVANGHNGGPNAGQCGATIVMQQDTICCN